MVIATIILLLTSVVLLAGVVFWNGEAQAYKQRNHKAQLKIVELERQLEEAKPPPASFSFDDLLAELENERG